MERFLNVQAKTSAPLGRLSHKSKINRVLGMLEKCVRGADIGGQSVKKRLPQGMITIENVFKVAESLKYEGKPFRLRAEQKSMFSHMLMSMMPYIFGKQLDANKDIIEKRLRMSSFNEFANIIAPRRTGKTVCLAAFAASVLIVMDNIEVIVFSISLRVSKNFFVLMKDFMATHPRGKWLMDKHAVINNADELVIANPEKPNMKKRVRVFPDNPRVRSFPLLRRADDGGVVDGAAALHTLTLFFLVFASTRYAPQHMAAGEGYTRYVFRAPRAPLFVGLARRVLHVDAPQSPRRHSARHVHVMSRQVLHLGATKIAAFYGARRGVQALVAGNETPAAARHRRFVLSAHATSVDRVAAHRHHRRRSASFHWHSVGTLHFLLVIHLERGGKVAARASKSIAHVLYDTLLHYGVLVDSHVGSEVQRLYLPPHHAIQLDVLQRRRGRQAHFAALEDGALEVQLSGAPLDVQRRYHVGERDAQGPGRHGAQLDIFHYALGREHQLRSPCEFAAKLVDRRIHKRLGAVSGRQIHGHEALVDENNRLVFALHRHVLRRRALECQRRRRHGANKFTERNRNIRYGHAPVDEVDRLSVVGPAHVADVVAHKIHKLAFPRSDTSVMHDNIRSVVEYESVYCVKRIRHRHSGSSR